MYMYLNGFADNKGIIFTWSHHQCQNYILKVSTQLSLEFSNQVLSEINDLMSHAQLFAKAMADSVESKNMPPFLHAKIWGWDIFAGN